RSVLVRVTTEGGAGGDGGDALQERATVKLVAQGDLRGEGREPSPAPSRASAPQACRLQLSAAPIVPLRVRSGAFPGASALAPAGGRLLLGAAAQAQGLHFFVEVAALEIEQPRRLGDVVLGVRERELDDFPLGVLHLLAEGPVHAGPEAADGGGRGSR